MKMVDPKHQTKWNLRKCASIFNKLMEDSASEEIFWKSPGKRWFWGPPGDANHKQFLLYKKTIRNPLGLSCIWSKLTKKEYQTTAEFLEDMTRVFKNAMKFNLPASENYTEARRLMGELTQQLSKEFGPKSKHFRKFGTKVYEPGKIVRLLGKELRKGAVWYHLDFQLPTEAVPKKSKGRKLRKRKREESDAKLDESIAGQLSARRALEMRSKIFKGWFAEARITKQLEELWETKRNEQALANSVAWRMKNPT